MRTIIKKAYKTQRLNPQSGDKSVHSNTLVEKVWQYCPFGGTKLLILLYLAKTHNENDDSSYPSQKRIAQYCRVSRQQINKLIGELYESGDVDVISYGGNATTNGSTNRYRLTKYINLAFDGSISPSVLEKDIRPNAKRPVTGKLIENTVNSSGQPPVNSSRQRTKNFEPKTINNVPKTQSVVGDVKTIVPNKPSLKTSDLQSFMVSTPQIQRGENWLVGIAKQLWGKELSEAQVKELNKPVRCVFGTAISDYPSPMEYAMDDRYGELFRQWVMNKKNPKADRSIAVVGIKKWVTQHIRNYTSPEGWLTWLQRTHAIDLSVNPITTIMDKSRIYDLVEMDMFVHNRSNPMNEVAISTEFKAFYAENIGKVKNNNDFKTLWENR